MYVTALFHNKNCIEKRVLLDFSENALLHNCIKIDLYKIYITHVKKRQFKNVNSLKLKKYKK